MNTVKKIIITGMALCLVGIALHAQPFWDKTFNGSLKFATGGMVKKVYLKVDWSVFDRDRDIDIKPMDWGTDSNLKCEVKMKANNPEPSDYHVKNYFLNGAGEYTMLPDYVMEASGQHKPDKLSYCIRKCTLSITMEDGEHFSIPCRIGVKFSYYKSGSKNIPKFIWWIQSNDLKREYHQCSDGGYYYELQTPYTYDFRKVVIYSNTYTDGPSFLVTTNGPRYYRNGSYDIAPYCGEISGRKMKI